MQLNSNYTLADAFEKAKLYPETFERPSDRKLGNLKVGDWAKLCFEDGAGNAERMWVKVQRRLGDTFDGTLANRPCWAGFGDVGDRVVFKTCNVYDTIDWRENLPGC
jgi:hypothetical protein